MSQVAVERYGPASRAVWDETVRSARQGVFLFERDYMDYHADRFVDHSLLFRVDGKLVALLPASAHGDELRSHGGLTYGGLVYPARTTTSLVLEVMQALQEHMRAEGFKSLLYKPVPHIYHDVPSEEDLYALFRVGARLVRRDLSSTVRMDARVPLSKGRKSSLTVARKAGVIVQRSEDYAGFMALEEEHLLSRFGVRPVHTAEEMTLLAGQFPDRIALFTATLDGALLAGTVLYVSRHVAHAQYIAASEAGKAVSAMDAVLHRLLTQDYADKRWFDFGISTDQAGHNLNAGLAANKESYGARAVVYDFYEVPAAEPVGGTPS